MLLQYSLTHITLIGHPVKSGLDRGEKYLRLVKREVSTAYKKEVSDAYKKGFDLG